MFYFIVNCHKIRCGLGAICESIFENHYKYFVQIVYSAWRISLFLKLSPPLHTVWDVFSFHLTVSLSFNFIFILSFPKLSKAEWFLYVSHSIYYAPPWIWCLVFSHLSLFFSTCKILKIRAWVFITKIGLLVPVLPRPRHNVVKNSLKTGYANDYITISASKLILGLVV